jgi:hypothetical protein
VDAVADADAGTPTPTFGAAIHPVLTTACATCHSPEGAASATGFVLMGDAAADYTETLDFVDLVSPPDSDLLQKAAGVPFHGGGTIFEAGSSEYDLILAWIEGGAPE